MKRHRHALTIALLCAAALLPAGCGNGRRDVLWQTSTISALLAGVYDGQVTLAELKRHGDFGLGTFNALDGEMIVLDGRVYQIGTDGKARLPDPKTTKTPFAAVTFFDEDRMLALDEGMDYDAVRKLLAEAVDTPNLPYAVRIEGEFSYVKVRSVAAQQRPYRRLVEAVSSQPTYEHRNVKGTMVGFRLPPYIGGINVPGCHLHFITADRKAGGHVLAFRTKDARVILDLTDRVHLALPARGDFYDAQLAPPAESEMKKVEK